MTSIAPLLEAFFTERLIGQRRVASYRDAWCLLLRFVQARTGKAPSQLTLGDLDAPTIGAYLDYLESDRGVNVRTRNARLTAIRALFNFAAYRHPEHAATIQRVLAIPTKRTTKSRRNLPRRAGNHSPACCARPLHLARSARPCPADDGIRDRPASERAHRAQLRLDRLRHRCSCALSGQRAQGEGHTPTPRSSCRASSLARRASRSTKRSPLSRAQRSPAQPRRPPPAGRTSRRNRRPDLPVASIKERDSSHQPAQSGHEPPQP